MNPAQETSIFERISELMVLWPSEANAQQTQRMLKMLLQDYYQWHQALTPHNEQTSNKKNGSPPVLMQAEMTLQTLSDTLGERSIPWPAPNYLAHMNTDIMMPAQLAYFAAMLYNPNNVTPEASPVTTELEYELSDEFCRLFGFDPQEGWAHLSSGGHASNYEAIWMAKNLKRFALEFAKSPQFAAQAQVYSAAQLMNLPPEIIADWLMLAKSADCVADIISQAKSQKTRKGRLFVANGRHYAWDKCADLCDLQLETIALDTDFRLNLDELERKIVSCFEAGEPVTAVVATVGSSGEGSVDDITGLLELKARLIKTYQMGFYLHVDAAFGGYFRSVLIESDECTDDVREALLSLFKQEVSSALLSLQYADSITVDPHKCGYAPYPAGCLAIKKRCYSWVISSQSHYFDQAQGKHMDFGPFTLEGARPGAAVAAVWMTHRLLGFHQNGLGALLAGNLLTAQFIHNSINCAPALHDQWQLQSVYAPDLTMINLSIRHRQNPALDMSHLNLRLLDKLNHARDCNPHSLWFSRNTYHENVSAMPHHVLRCCVMKSILPENRIDFIQQLLSHCTQAMAQIASN